ncbi:MAG: hypothetical protein QOD56_2725 [Gammaproteobacteria bacterium]|jgi:hypothetical protein|nr:hypothetical protein [Gammaproteobacteria bacterium]
MPSGHRPPIIAVRCRKRLCLDEFAAAEVSVTLDRERFGLQEHPLWRMLLNEIVYSVDGGNILVRLTENPHVQSAFHQLAPQGF